MRKYLLQALACPLILQACNSNNGNQNLTAVMDDNKLEYRPVIDFRKGNM